LGWRVDPAFWRLSDEAFWVSLEGRVESFLAGCVDLVGLTVVDLSGVIGPMPACW
jgi:hypothetical protein